MADNQQLCTLLPCYVCKKTLSGNLPVIVLKCGHIFHEVCVDKFQRNKNPKNCPQQIFFGCQPDSMKIKTLLPVVESDCYDTKLDQAKKLEEKVCNVNFIFIIDSRLIHFNLRMQSLPNCWKII
jgi:hypothetical protein